MKISKLRSLLGFSLLLAASAARAQEQHLSLTADAVAGGGPRTRYNGTTWFRGSATAFGRLSIALVGPRTFGVRPVVTLDRSLVLENGDEVSMCDPAPDGSCYWHFPRNRGAFVGAGIRAAPTRWADVGIVAGLGSMGGSSQYFDGDLAVRFATHARLLVLTRRLVIRQPSGFRLWWQPFAAGIRLQ
jgi:hypothetical protein